MSINSNAMLLYINNVLMPTVASDDAISIPTTYEVVSMVTQTGRGVSSPKPIPVVIKAKLLRGGDNSGGGFLSSAVVSKSLQDLMLSGQKVNIRIELNDGSARVTDTATCTREDLKSYSATEVMLNITIDNPYKWSSLSNN